MRCEDATVDIGSSLNGELDARGRGAAGRAPVRLSRLPPGIRAWRARSGAASARSGRPRSIRRRCGSASPPRSTPFRPAAIRRRSSVDRAPPRGGRAGRRRPRGGARSPPLSCSVSSSGEAASVQSPHLTSDAQITSEMAALRRELHDTRQMVTLSLLQQTSASERLKGVSSTGHIDDPGADVIGALLDVLAHDPNVNVRLASIDALARFVDQPVVRRGVVQALSQRTSPLVQIALIDFLVQAKERTSLDALRQIAADPAQDAAVRGRATWGLEQLS